MERFPQLLVSMLILLAMNILFDISDKIFEIL